MATHYCEKCGKTMDEKEFYKSKNIEKYPPDGTLNICKKCLTMHVDNWDPETYKWILQEVNVPYIKQEWDGLLEKYGTDPAKITGMTIIGRYLSKMKLKQWSKYNWDDTEVLEEKAKQEKITAMKAQGLTGEEIDEQLAIDRTPAKPKALDTAQAAVGTPEFIDYEEPDEFSEALTEEDKRALRLKWGRGYRADEWVRLEQLYNDMEASYDIQGAGMKDTLIMICKASIKANALIDAGDIEGFQKMSKVYNELMKSAKLTAAQIKAEDSESIDSIGEIVALCEKEGFIPRYYVEGPQDHVDRTIQDMQAYTRSLVTEELNLGNMIESAVREIESDRAREANIETDDIDMDEEAKFEASLFAEDEVKDSSVQDYEEFEAFQEELAFQDEEAYLNGAE